MGFQKEKHLEIPAEALREALTNALCHRQLEKYSLTPSIAIYDDRVEIENPGRLPFDLTPETIKSAHASYPYNPLIAEVLFKSSFLESWGSGVGRMVDACRAQGVPEPEYEVAGGFVRIVFRRAVIGGRVKDDNVNSDVNGQINGQLNGQLNDSQKETFEFIKAHEGYNTTRIANGLGKPFRTIDKHINVLLELNMIEGRGSKKTGGYYVK